jgi:hypothetical protein
VVLQSGVEAAFGESWQAVLHVLTAATTRLTRQEILETWPADYGKPDATTLWRWLSRAAAQGVVRQDGTGRQHDPFRYWLPARQELIRPDDGSPAELQAWNDRIVAEMLANLELKSSANPPVETPFSAGEDYPAPAPLAAAEAGLAPEPAAPFPLPPAEAVAPEPPVRLPYPWTLMNPAEVPDWVWKQARAAAAKMQGENGASPGGG